MHWRWLFAFPLHASTYNYYPHTQTLILNRHKQFQMALGMGIWLEVAGSGWHTARTHLKQAVAGKQNLTLFPSLSYLPMPATLSLSSSHLWQYLFARFSPLFKTIFYTLHHLTAHGFFCTFSNYLAFFLHACKYLFHFSLVQAGTVWDIMPGDMGTPPSWQQAGLLFSTFFPYFPFFRTVP